MSEEYNLSYYVSILSGALLAISEALPYLSKVKGNGIIQTLLNTYGKYDEEKKKEQEQEQKKLDEVLVRLDEIKSIVQSQSKEHPQ